MRAEISNIRQRHLSANEFGSSGNVINGTSPRTFCRSLSSSSLAMRLVESNDTRPRLSSPLFREPSALLGVSSMPSSPEVVGSESVGQAALPENAGNRADFRANRLAAVYVSGDPLEPAGSPLSINPSLPLLDLDSLPLNDSQVSSTSSLLSPDSGTAPGHPDSLASCSNYEDARENASSSGVSSLYASLRGSPSEPVANSLANSTRRESLSEFYESFADSIGQTNRLGESNEERDEAQIVEENGGNAEEEMEVEIVEERREASGSRATGVDEEPEPEFQPQRPARANRSNLRKRDGRVTRHFSKCAVCGKGYRQRRHLQNHLSSHLMAMCETQEENGTTTIKCSICQRSFRTKIGLTSHLRAHANRVVTDATS